MPKPQRLSRFSLVYLASRHAGMVFFFLALGIGAGIAWRCLVEPTRYSARADIAFTVASESAAPDFNWDGKTAGWLAVPNNAYDRDLLGNNLRRAVKLAATEGLELDTEKLNAELAPFQTGRMFSPLLLPSGIAGYLGPRISLNLRDLAANLDFQTLAAVVADLDPARDVTDWDFSFFNSGGGGQIARPGPGDRHFRVFYHLHRLLHPSGPAPTPRIAWSTAVGEVADRLDREVQFAGGGGFGHTAKRELMREIAAIPALAANSLYRATSWPSGDELKAQTEVWAWRWSTLVDVAASRRNGRGVVSADMRLDLHPFAFPRDTVVTRVPPLAVATLLAYIAALEQPDAAPAPPPAPEAEPEPVREPDPAPAVVHAEPPSVAVSPTVRVDPGAEAKRQSRMRAVEAGLRQAKIDRAAALRALETARDREKTLAMEALAARERADRLSERLDLAIRETPPPDAPLSLEIARLNLSRDEVLERLARLLQTCTEEHPFVRQARRELAAIEARLAQLNPGLLAAREAEIRETRIRNLRMEWDAANANAANLEERRRRVAADVQNALNSLAALERRISDLDAELANLAGEPVATIVVPATAPLAPPPPMPEPPPPPAPIPQPIPAEPAPQPQPARQVGSAVQFSAVPETIPLVKTPPDWEAPFLGALLGLCLGLIWIILREVAARRFANAAEARRMVNLPLLAALPAYDAQSFRAAAKTMKGELFGNQPGSLVLIPASVETSEPKPVGRRGKIKPARPRRRWFGWVAGLVVIALAALVLHGAARLAQPRVGFAGDMALPGAEAFKAPGAEPAEDWGNMP